MPVACAYPGYLAVSEVNIGVVEALPSAIQQGGVGQQRWCRCRRVVGRGKRFGVGSFGQGETHEGGYGEVFQHGSSSGNRGREDTPNRLLCQRGRRNRLSSGIAAPLRICLCAASSIYRFTSKMT